MFQYSVVATTYNDEKNIIGYLESICNQSLKPSEIVIADGGSKDNTVKLIYEYSQKVDVNIIVCTGKRLNIAEGYNEAIKNSNYEWIGISGIGNSYDKDYFNKLSESTNDYDIIYSPIRGLKDTKFSEVYINTFLDGEKGNDIGMPSNHGALIKKDIFIKEGFFYENFIYAGEDAEFYKLLKEKEYPMKIVYDAMAYWHVPRTFKEFRKQIENYTIGDLQILSNEQIHNSFIKKMICIVFGVILIILLISVAKMYSFIIFGGFVVVFCLLILIMQQVKSFTLKLYRKFAPVFIIIHYHKYLNDSYKVKRKSV